jgi:hypothetical protein
MEKPGVTSKSFRLPLPSKKWLIGGGVIAAVVLALSQCGGGNEGQQQGAVPEANTPPADPNKTYFQIIHDAPLSSADSPDAPDYKTNAPILGAGSCVESLNKEGDRTNQVRAVDAEGKETTGYVFQGHIGDKNLDPKIAGFTCKATFVVATAQTEATAAEPKIPTYIAAEDLNLRDGSMATEIWGTIAKGSCISFAGSRDNGLIQIGHVERGQNPQDMGYKWVIESKLQPSEIPVDKCFASLKQNPAPALDF